MSVAKQHLSPAGLFSTRGLGFTHVLASPGFLIEIEATAVVAG